MSQLIPYISNYTVASVDDSTYNNDIDNLQIIKTTPFNLDIASCQMEIRLSLDSRFSLSSLSEESENDIDDVKLLCLPEPMNIPLKSILISSSTTISKELKNRHRGVDATTATDDEIKNKQKKTVRFADEASIINASDIMDSLRIPNGFNIDKCLHLIPQQSMSNIETQFTSANKKSKIIASCKKLGQLCPYCDVPVFIQHKQTYTDHMLVEHGIFHNGKKVNDPLISQGDMQDAGTLEIDQFECLTCPYDRCSHNIFITLGKVSYIKGYMKYLRHIAYMHRDGKGIKPRGKNPVSQRYLRNARKEKEKKHRDRNRMSKNTKKNKNKNKKKHNKVKE